MKKFALICALLGVTCGFAACSSDDDDSADKKSNGASCSAAEECKSGICTDGKCAAASSDDKKDDGADCAKAEECKSGVCTDGKCVAASSDDKKDDGADCAKAEECKSGVCTDGKCVAASEEDPCKDKNEGDECAENSYCIEGVCTLDEGCKSDDDCTSEYPTCDTEKKLCYKLDADYEINCEQPDDKTIAYLAKRIYSDDSDFIESQVCEGETPVCKPGVGCAAEDPDTIECNETMACADPTKVCVDNKCVENTTDLECNDTDKLCAGEGKACAAGKCIDKPVEAAACDDKFVSVCEGSKNVLICKDGKVAKMNCASGMSCWVGPDGQASCFDTCGGDLKLGDVEYRDCDAKTNEAYNYICTKDFYDNAIISVENVTACGDKICDATGTSAVCK